MPSFPSKLSGNAVRAGLAVLALGAAALAAQAVLSGGDAPEQVARPLPAAVIEARYQDAYETERLFPGRVSSAQASDLGFQVSGEIDAVLVQVGDRLTTGQVLARLDPTRLDLRLEEARAAREEARAALRRAEAALGRIDGLAAEGFATAQERDDALAERDGALERVRRLDRAVAVAGQDADDGELRAPFGGVVVTRYADGGATVGVGEPVLRVNAEGALEAEVGVPAEAAGRLRVGQRHALWTGDARVRAMITGIGDDVDAATRTVTVKLVIDEEAAEADGARLVPGELVRLALTETRAGEGAWVPAAALTESYRGLWSVFVVRADDEGVARVARKDVEVVSFGSEHAFVRGTLEDGDAVIASAPFRFVPGQAVRPVPAETPTNIAVADGAGTVR